MRRLILSIISVLVSLASLADIKVSDVTVFSGLPWKEVVICYTTTGVTNSTDVIRLMVTDKVAKKCHTVKTLSGGELTEGRHTIRWNGAPGGVKISSEDVLFSVTVVDSEGVQLWENGPYWAECNVRASRPEDYGDYFSWGETDGFAANSIYFQSKYCPTYGKDSAALQAEGYINAIGNLAARYDAATKRLGAPWRMPTDAEWEALKSNCDTTWMTLNGVSGRLVTGKGAYASKSIFLPASGGGLDYGREDTLGIFTSASGSYWSSTPNSRSSEDVICLEFGPGFFWCYGSPRYIGRSVRPLRGSAQ